jgi:hypothetical protein
MIIMIAANRMNPTAVPLAACRSARAADDEYASSVMCRSLLCCAAGRSAGRNRTTERTVAPGRRPDIIR